MKKGNIINLISRIREQSHAYIIKALKARGIEGIVPSHGDIMVVLFREKFCTMKDLAERIHRTKPTVTVLVDKLVECGYVTKVKSESDKRETNISLTEKGLELKPHFEAISRNLNRIVYEAFDEQKAEQLEADLNIIYNSLCSNK